MSHEDHESILNAYGKVKEASLKKLHNVSFQLHFGKYKAIVTVKKKINRCILREES